MKALMFRDIGKIEFLEIPVAKDQLTGSGIDKSIHVRHMWFGCENSTGQACL